MSDLVKDVAKEIERRRRRRRLVFMLIWAAAVVALFLYLQFGKGFGIGHGSGTGTGPGSATNPQKPRCAVRVAADGLTLDGKPATRDQIVSGCAQGADVVVTGDARQGDWDDLRAALAAAKIPVFERKM